MLEILQKLVDEVKDKVKNQTIEGGFQRGYVAANLLLI